MTQTELIAPRPQTATSTPVCDDVDDDDDVGRRAL